MIRRIVLLTIMVFLVSSQCFAAGLSSIRSSAKVTTSKTTTKTTTTTVTSKATDDSCTTGDCSKGASSSVSIVGRTVSTPSKPVKLAAPSMPGKSIITPDFVIESLKVTESIAKPGRHKWTVVIKNNASHLVKAGFSIEASQGLPWRSAGRRTTSNFGPRQRKTFSSIFTKVKRPRKLKIVFKKDRTVIAEKIIDFPVDVSAERKALTVATLIPTKPVGLAAPSISGKSTITIPDYVIKSLEVVRSTSKPAMHVWTAVVRSNLSILSKGAFSVQGFQGTPWKSVKKKTTSSFGPRGEKTFSAMFKKFENSRELKVVFKNGRTVIADRKITFPVEMSVGKEGITLPALDISSRATSRSGSGVVENGRWPPQEGNPSTEAVKPSFFSKLKGAIDSKFGTGESEPEPDPEPDPPTNTTTLVMDTPTFSGLGNNQFTWYLNVSNAGSTSVSQIMIMPSKRTGPSWVPAASPRTISSIAGGGNYLYTANFDGAGITEFKFDMLVKENSSSPYVLMQTVIIPFSSSSATDLTQNIEIVNFSFEPDNCRYRWSADIINNNTVAYTGDLSVQAQINTNGTWDNVGGFAVGPFGPGTSDSHSMTFWPDMGADQFRVIVRAGTQYIAESPVVQLNGYQFSGTITNPSVSPQGTIASWAVTVNNTSNQPMCSTVVKTYHRPAGGSWAQASSNVTFGTMTAGASNTATGIFTPGSSSEFKAIFMCKQAEGNSGGTVVEEVINWQSSL